MLEGNGGANVATGKTAKRAALAPDAKTQALTGGTLTDAQINELGDKAQHGDVKAWHALKAGLDMVPHWERHYESPAVLARRTLLDATVGNNLLVKEAWERRAQAMTKELAGPDPSLLERTLCDRIATCWLDMALTDQIYAARLKDGFSLATGDYYQKQRDRAHNRYLSACLALAKTRRLLAPIAQQINIAQPGAAQLNIAQPAQPAAKEALPEAPATVEADPRSA